MSIKTLIYIAFIWLLLNAIIPILFRSLERIYQPHIDLLVKGLVSILKWVILILMQGFLILFYLPTIILGTFFIWLLPEIFSKEAIEKKMKEGKISKFFAENALFFHNVRLLLRKDFWDIVLSKNKKDLPNSQPKGREEEK